MIIAVFLLKKMIERKNWTHNRDWLKIPFDKIGCSSNNNNRRKNFEWECHFSSSMKRDFYNPCSMLNVHFDSNALPHTLSLFVFCFVIFIFICIFNKVFPFWRSFCMCAGFPVVLSIHSGKIGKKPDESIKPGKAYGPMKMERKQTNK